MNVITDLLDFLDSSPLNFHAVATCACRLEKAGFVRLDPSDRWEIAPAGKYYVTANDSAIFAFVAGDGGPASPFHIIAAHSDSPADRFFTHGSTVRCRLQDALSPAAPIRCARHTGWYVSASRFSPFLILQSISTAVSTKATRCRNNAT